MGLLLLPAWTPRGRDPHVLLLYPHTGIIGGSKRDASLCWLEKEGVMAIRIGFG